MSAKAIVLTIVIAVPLFIGVMTLVLANRLGPKIAERTSRLIDKYNIRPSLAEVAYLSVSLFHCFFIIFIFGRKHQPIWLVLFTTLFLSGGFAYLIETIRKPPKTEYRPRWYKGVGNPKWVTWKRGMAYKHRFTLSWLLISLTLFCCSLGLQSSTITAQWRGRRVLSANGISPHATHVDFRNLSMSKSEIEEVLRYSNALHSVDLTGTDIDDQTLELLARHAKLNQVRLNNTSITDAGLRHLSGLKRLQILELNNTNVTGIAFQDFPGDPLLLWVANCQLTKPGLHAIAKMQSQGPAHIRKLIMPSLESCEIVRSDPVLLEAFPHLAAMNTWPAIRPIPTPDKK